MASFLFNNSSEIILSFTLNQFSISTKDISVQKLTAIRKFS